MTAREPVPQDNTTAVAPAAAAEMARWLDTPAGRYVLAWEQAQLDAQVSDIFGFHAIQLGLLPLDSLRANRMPLRIRVATSSLEAGIEGSAQVHASFEELPFASRSVDLLVLPHSLEWSAEPHQLLREAERVLVPEGKLVITCFNPYSLWGLRQQAGHWLRRPFLPRSPQLLSLPRGKDWLKLLDLEVEGGKFGCYRPPTGEKGLERSAFMEKAGDRWWPVLGAVYLLVAVKRVRGMRLIGPVWKTRSQRAATIAPAANRSPEREAA
ncbi:class I SAM-dependent methyltransferase [soil metagenome]